MPDLEVITVTNADKTVIKMTALFEPQAYEYVSLYLTQNDNTNKDAIV